MKRRFDVRLLVLLVFMAIVAAFVGYFVPSLNKPLNVDTSHPIDANDSPVD